MAASAREERGVSGQNLESIATLFMALICQAKEHIEHLEVFFSRTLYPAALKEAQARSAQEKEVLLRDWQAAEISWQQEREGFDRQRSEIQSKLDRAEQEKENALAEAEDLRTNLRCMKRKRAALEEDMIAKHTILHSMNQRYRNMKMQYKSILRHQAVEEARHRAVDDEETQEVDEGSFSGSAAFQEKRTSSRSPARACQNPPCKGNAVETLVAAFDRVQRHQLQASTSENRVQQVAPSTGKVQVQTSPGEGSPLQDGKEAAAVENFSVLRTPPAEKVQAQQATSKIHQERELPCKGSLEKHAGAVAGKICVFKTPPKIQVTAKVHQERTSPGKGSGVGKISVFKTPPASTKRKGTLREFFSSKTEPAWRTTRVENANARDPHDDFLNTPQELVLQKIAVDKERKQASDEQINSKAAAGKMPLVDDGDDDEIEEEPEGAAAAAARLPDFVPDTLGVEWEDDAEAEAPQPEAAKRSADDDPFGEISKEWIETNGRQTKKKQKQGGAEAMNPAASPPKWKKKQAPKYKYNEPVRKKAEREGLTSSECKQCKKFYDAVLPSGENNNNMNKARCDHHKEVSRHRYRHVPPSTPEGFWNLDFDTQ